MTSRKCQKPTGTCFVLHCLHGHGHGLHSLRCVQPPISHWFKKQGKSSSPLLPGIALRSGTQLAISGYPDLVGALHLQQAQARHRPSACCQEHLEGSGMPRPACRHELKPQKLVIAYDTCTGAIDSSLSAAPRRQLKLQHRDLGGLHLRGHQ